MTVQVEPERIGTSNGQPPTVIVIGDDARLRLGTAALLAQRGYSILTAASGHDAMAIFRAPFSPIDAVLLDLKLPDLDGITLCQRIREMYPDLPVMVWAAELNPAEEAQLTGLGILHRLIRAVPGDELLATLTAIFV